MKDDNTQEKVKKEMNIIDVLQKYTVRTFWQILIHVIVAILLSVLVSLFISKCVVISSSNFTVIASSISAASGVLLAVTITLAIFFSRHTTDWRDNLIQRLRESRDKLEIQNEEFC